MNQGLLVTGFGPFKGFPSNPSEHLARTCGEDNRIIDVSYGAADKFLRELNPESFETLLLMGAHGTATCFQLELLAHNWAGGMKDICEETRAGVLRSAGSAIQAGTLWPSLPLSPILDSTQATLSFHPGSYLCNYIYYEALCYFPRKRVGFLHVPRAQAMPLESQRDVLKTLLQLIRAIP